MEHPFFFLHQFSGPCLMLFEEFQKVMHSSRFRCVSEKILVAADPVLIILVT